MNLFTKTHPPSIFFDLLEVSNAEKAAQRAAELDKQRAEEARKPSLADQVKAHPFSISTESGEEFVIKCAETKILEHLLMLLEEADIPGIRHLRWDKLLLVPISEKSAVALSKFAPAAVFNELSGSLMKRMLLIGVLADARAKRLGQYFFNNAPAPQIPYEFKLKPFKHQIIGVDEMATAEFFGCFLDMGTGKTKTAIDSLCYLVQKEKQAVALAKKNYYDHPFRALIICPKAVMINWCREFKKNATVSYKIVSLCGLPLDTFKERKDLCIEGLDDLPSLLRLFANKAIDAHIVIVNWDRLASRLPELMACFFDACWADEAHKIKSPHAARSQAAHHLASMVKRRYALTGTPVTDNVLDLWSIFEFMAPKMGLLGATTYGAFEKMYSDNEGPRLVGRLRALAARHSMVVTKEQCLDLPEKMFEVQQIKMGDKQAELYKKVTSEVLIELEKMEMAGEVTITNILTQYLRLAQVTSGFIKTMEGKIVEVEAPKRDALLDFLEDTDEKVVVWSRFRHEIQQIHAECKKRSIGSVQYYGDVSAADKQKAIDLLNSDPKTRVFIGHARSGGEGINLTSASIGAYISNDFSYTCRKQSLDRIHRIGQTKKVLYKDFVCEGTIDEYVLERLKDKEEVSSGFASLQGLKEFLEGSLKRV